MVTWSRRAIQALAPFRAGRGLLIVTSKPDFWPSSTAARLFAGDASDARLGPTPWRHVGPPKRLGAATCKAIPKVAAPPPQIVHTPGDTRKIEGSCAATPRRPPPVQDLSLKLAAGDRADHLRALPSSLLRAWRALAHRPGHRPHPPLKHVFFLPHADPSRHPRSPTSTPATPPAFRDDCWPADEQLSTLAAWAVWIRRTTVKAAFTTATAARGLARVLAPALS